MTEKQPSSTLVTITDQLELKLLEIITTNYKLQNENELPTSFTTSCETQIANADALNLIQTILEEKNAIKTIFNLDTLDDIISTFNILCNLLNKIEDKESAFGVCKDMVTVILDDGIDIEKRIVLLFTLYNLRSDVNEKCYLLSKIITLCSTTPSTALLLLRHTDSNDDSTTTISSSSLLSDMIQVDYITKMLDEWNVDVAYRQMLFRSIVDAMKKIGGMKSSGDEDRILNCDDLFYAECTRQKFLLLIIETYTDSSLDTDALEAAEEASILAIRDPITLFNEQRGMLSFSAIKKLQTSNKPLYDLLTIFQVGTLEDYQSFLKNNPNAFTTLNLNEEDCLRHIRLLTFVSLASQGYKELPYQTIADKLQIPLTDVESWVISAVSHNLVTAKMDQLKEVVMVEKYLVRSFGFGTQEWKELHLKLEEWKEHVKYVLDGLKECDNRVPTTN